MDTSTSELLAAQLRYLLSLRVYGIPVVTLFTITIIIWMRKEYVWMRSGYNSDFRWRDVPILLSPGLCYGIIWNVGTLFPVGGSLHDVLPKDIPAFFVQALTLLELPLVLYVVWRLRGMRVLTLILGALHLWYSFVLGLYSTMAITGVWL